MNRRLFQQTPPQECHLLFNDCSAQNKNISPLILIGPCWCDRQGLRGGSAVPCWSGLLGRVAGAVGRVTSWCNLPGLRGRGRQGHSVELRGTLAGVAYSGRVAAAVERNGARAGVASLGRVAGYPLNKRTILEVVVVIP